MGRACHRKEDAWEIGRGIDNGAEEAIGRGIMIRDGETENKGQDDQEKGINKGWEEKSIRGKKKKQQEKA